MKVLGMVVEYNPFHNGHAYHLAKSKELCGADYSVCVMSGNFIQRGEPAIVNKWSRAEMALRSGIDLVIELPLVYAAASAEYFSFGAVKILDSLGIVDFLCFGSEHGEINELDKIAGILSNEPDEYKESLKKLLGSGISYPAAREKALKDYLSNENLLFPNIEAIISSSNNILGIEYLKALKKLDSSIIPITIKRISNEYNSAQLTGDISSATSIRKHIKSSTHNSINDPDLVKSLPHVSSSILEEEFACGRGPVSSEDFGDLMLYTIRNSSTTRLSSLSYVTEGLENRIKSAAENSGNYDELVENISTRRYTRTRVQRILLNALLNIASEDFNVFNTFGGPQYIRVLGFNSKGRKLLSEINRKATLPVIIKAADYRSSCNPLLKRMFEIEALSTDIYVLGYKNSLYKKAGQEFTQNIVMLK